MARIERFEDLEVWKNARIICAFVEGLFQTTGIGNNYRLRNQMEGSSGSIMDNIAEGFDRDGNKEFINFLSFSKGSTSELKSQTYRAFDKKLISEEQFNKLIDLCELEKNKIGAFMYYLKNSDIKGQKFKRD
ncbi:four helix bundle protein [Aequorivita sp. F47161]|jgi:four helix bundle protein|uniref:Four helix bundle protein n=1 Tax=Aequorivita vitellina TaxID=2874475 RepID=A0A9X1R172_9FLAO|nr:four helix bundle protein [Aequorivita vitellina]MCG2420314.1 four helix bundle protein [Aequorivita vitellina]